MSRAPAFEIMFNGNNLRDLGILHLVESIEFEESVDKFDSVKMVVNDGEALTRATMLTQHGSVLQLAMGYHNEGIYPMTIVFLKSIEPDFANQKVTFTFTGYLKAMDAGEKDRTLGSKTIKEVVQEVVADYSVLEVGVIEGGDVIISDTITQSKQTDLSLLEGIASQFGLKWKIEPSNNPKKWVLSLYKLEYDKSKAKDSLPLHAYPTKEFQDDTKSLKLKAFRPKSNILGVSSNVEIRSNNPNQPINVSSSTLTTKDDLSGVRGSEVVATVFGQVTRVYFMENVSDEEAAQVIAEQLQQENELAFVATSECQLNEGIPNLRVGDVRNVVPHGIVLFDKVFSGAYLVTGTRHRISSTEGYDTWVTMNKNSLTVPPPPEPSFNGGGVGEGSTVLIFVYPNNTAEGWYINFNSDGTPMLGSEISQSEIEANEYWMSHVRRNVAGFNFNRGLTTGGGVTGLVGTAAGFGAFVGLGPSESSTMPNVGYARNNSPVQILIDPPANYNTDVLGVLMMATPVYDPYEVGELPYSEAQGLLDYLRQNRAAFERLSDEERAEMVNAMSEAEQQALISQSFASRQAYAAAVGGNAMLQLLYRFGN
jgi:hypothetical protein